MRPATHREQIPDKRCGNCRFAHIVSGKLDLLCFKGDQIEVTGKSGYPIDSDWIDLNGEDVGCLEGDAYSDVWGGRVVDGTDVCDEWESE